MSGVLHARTSVYRSGALWGGELRTGL